MTHPENGKPLWTEARVETLLEEFFEREMPPDLRTDPPGLPPRDQIGLSRRSWPTGHQASLSTPRQRSRSQSSILAVGFSAVLMVMVALLAWDRPDSSVSNKDRQEDSAVSEHADSPTQNDSFNPLDREGQGPVEMRPGIHHVGEGDPAEPSNFPELDIEVFPLDQGPARGKNAPQPALPESQRPQSEPTPMPEENRPLPENLPPHSADPDEAAQERLLPELQSSPIPASGL